MLETQAAPSVREIGFGEAVREAIAEEMRRDPTVVLMGEDVAEAGTTFKVLKGLVEEFGKDRIIDTPISEAGFTGIGVGAAMTGMRPIVDIMFGDFLTLIMDQLVNQAAKTRGATPCDEDLVKVVVGLEEAIEIRRRLLAHRLECRIGASKIGRQLQSIALLEAADATTDRALERAHDGVQVLQVALGEGVDHDLHPGAFAERRRETFLHEAPNGFPHRRATDRKSIGELRFDEASAGRDAAANDEVADLFVGAAAVFVDPGGCRATRCRHS